jgi:uncharacterized membrane protein HdeD (DUF308 family)
MRRSMDTNIKSAARTVWWLVMVRAILTIVFGLVALVSPGMALLALVWVIGFYYLLDGVTAIGIAIRTRGEPHWGWTVVQGVISLLAGVAVLAWPGMTALVLLFLVAAWAVITGIGEIGEAFASRRLGMRAWVWTLAAGIINVLFGIVLVAWPASGILTLIWLVGIFALVGGIALLALAFRVRSVARDVGDALPTS